MTELSRFYGIVISMFFFDHNQPHVHVCYGGRNSRGAGAYATIIAVRTGKRVNGDVLPGKTMRLVRHWILEHAAELEEAWLEAQSGKNPKRIAPLHAKKGRKVK